MRERATREREETEEDGIINQLIALMMNATFGEDLSDLRVREHDAFSSKFFGASNAFGRCGVFHLCPPDGSLI